MVELITFRENFIYIIASKRVNRFAFQRIRHPQ